MLLTMLGKEQLRMSAPATNIRSSRSATSRSFIALVLEGADFSCRRLCRTGQQQAQCSTVPLGEGGALVSLGRGTGGCGWASGVTLADASKGILPTTGAGKRVTWQLGMILSYVGSPEHLSSFVTFAADSPITLDLEESWQHPSLYRRS